ncbi:MAG: multidrug effflux MFS transporter [Dehalococcoidia bacterium]
MTGSNPSAPSTVSEQARRRAESAPAVALLVALAALAPLSIDMFLPSMPTLAATFATDRGTLQLAVTLFIVAFAGSQLVYGPLSDRIGRRPVLLAGLALFVVGGLMSLAAPTVEVLLLGRVVQGLGGGAGPSLAHAIVLDVHGRERAGRVIAYMAIALPLAPAIAPIIGGFLQDSFGWHSVFVVLAGTGVLLAVAYRLVFPETSPRRAEGASARDLLADYRSLLSSPTYVAYALVMGLMFGGQLVFISSSSFVLIEEFGFSARAFGLSFGFVALGIMGGATVSSRLVDRWPQRRVVLLGAVVATGSSGVMAALAAADMSNPVTVLAPMFGTAFGFGVSRPAATAGALVPFQHMAGLASGLLMFTQMVVASTYNIAYSNLVAVSAAGLAGGVFLSVVAGLLTVLVLRPGRGLEATATAP